MLRPRIIPCLLLHDKGLVKTQGFGTHKYVGDPINAVRIFNEKEADELTFLDIDATVRGAEPDYQLIERLAAECRMPLCFGGGVREVAQAKRIIQLGVEKVALSAAALANPRLVTEIGEAVGRQSVVVVLDAKPDPETGEYEVWTHNATRFTGRNVRDVAGQMESLGAGEIVCNAIERDGSMKGYDLRLARMVRESVRVPVTLLGGAGSLAQIGDLIAECGVVGAAAGSLFVFKGIYRAVLINYPSRAQKDAIIEAALVRRGSAAALGQAALAGAGTGTGESDAPGNS